MCPSTSTNVDMKAPTYDKLGVKKIINCRGTYTNLSGSRALKVVTDAMTEATNAYVNIEELMWRVGERLSELTEAEWGYISSGCAAALAQISAACMTEGDPEKMVRLPNTKKMKNQVIMTKKQRNVYDYSIRMTGAKIVEVKDEKEFELSINDSTALAVVVGDKAHLEKFNVDKIIKICNNNDIICLVDAAAERLKVPNPYLELGAHAVAYSGGKCLRGPQASGLVLGKKDLLWTAFLNACPFHSFGRPMKAGKEEIMGLLAAVEAWINYRDHKSEWKMWESYLDTIRSSLDSISSLNFNVREPGVANVAPVLQIFWDTNEMPCYPQMLQKELLEDEPHIAVLIENRGIGIMPYMMEKGEDIIVAKKLFEKFSFFMKTKMKRDNLYLQSKINNISGKWELSVEFSFGKTSYMLYIDNNGKNIQGRIATKYSMESINGFIDGNKIQFNVNLGYEANTITYKFMGKKANNNGSILKGVVDLEEYGNAKWYAIKK